LVGYDAGVIAFRLENVGDGEYRVEATDEPSEPFASFVNGDLFGTPGVEAMLERARRVRAGDEQPFDEVRNAHEVTVTRETVTLENVYTGTSARCATDDFVAFLAGILEALHHA
jgi:hypothetical protein